MGSKLAAKFDGGTRCSLLGQKALKLGNLLVFAILVPETELALLGAETEPVRSGMEILELETGTETGAKSVKLNIGYHNHIRRCKQELADLDRQNMKWNARQWQQLDQQTTSLPRQYPEGLQKGGISLSP